MLVRPARAHCGRATCVVQAWKRDWLKLCQNVLGSPLQQCSRVMFGRASVEQMALETEEAVLRRTQLFARLTDSEMRTLCARVGKRHFAGGETLFSEGDQCHGLFVVATGRIRIFKLSPPGREQVLAVEGPGRSFAETPGFSAITRCFHRFDGTDKKEEQVREQTGNNRAKRY